tara:strand:+ start:424 stop:981 length:558 start_codon:yes stop_codon:yes gene_type:complete
MNSWWYVWDSEIDSNECDSIKSFFDTENKQVGKVGDNSANTQIRTSTVVGFPYGTKSNQEINNILEKYIVLANREAFGYSLNGLQEFQIAEYKEGGFYKEHMDTRLSDIRPSQRKLSITVQLSDISDYSGGDFMFSKDIPTPEQKIIKQKGTILVFPSFIYHQILPVTKGTRYSLVGWYEGNAWM